MDKLSMTNFDKETRIFWKSTENPEVRQKNSKHQNREVLAGVLLLLIVLPESLIYSGNIQIALLLYAGILIALSFISIFVKEQEIRNICQVFLLLPILRLMNFSVPFFPNNPLFSFIFVYTPLIIPLTIVASSQKFSYEQLGLNFKKIEYYFPISILIGFVLGQGESLIIQTTSLIPDLSLVYIFELAIIMVLFVGITEELLFRSFIQTRFEGILGAWPGLIFSSLIFGFMNSGYGTPYIIFYAFIEGLLIGRIFQKTRSLPFIALIHGFTSMFSFGIIPLMGHSLGFL